MIVKLKVGELGVTSRIALQSNQFRIQMNKMIRVNLRASQDAGISQVSRVVGGDEDV